MDITAATVLAESLMAQHGLTAAGWTFQMDGALGRLGLCQYGPKVISMGTAYVESAGEASVRDAALHEIAHALVGPFVLTPTGAKVRNRQGRATRTGHGWHWKVKAREIGCTSQSTGETPAATARHDGLVDAAKARAEHVADITSARTITRFRDYALTSQSGSISQTCAVLAGPSTHRILTEIVCGGWIPVSTATTRRRGRHDEKSRSNAI